MVYRTPMARTALASIAVVMVAVTATAIGFFAYYTFVAHPPYDPVLSVLGIVVAMAMMIGAAAIGSALAIANIAILYAFGTIRVRLPLLVLGDISVACAVCLALSGYTSLEGRPFLFSWAVGVGAVAGAVTARMSRPPSTSPNPCCGPPSRPPWPASASPSPPAATSTKKWRGAHR
jgi:hypothetical protein